MGESEGRVKVTRDDHGESEMATGTDSVYDEVNRNMRGQLWLCVRGAVSRALGGEERSSLHTRVNGRI